MENDNAVTSCQVQYVSNEIARLFGNGKRGQGWAERHIGGVGGTGVGGGKGGSRAIVF